MHINKVQAINVFNYHLELNRRVGYNYFPANLLIAIAVSRCTFQTSCFTDVTIFVDVNVSFRFTLFYLI